MLCEAFPDEEQLQKKCLKALDTLDVHCSSDVVS